MAFYQSYYMIYIIILEPLDFYIHWIHWIQFKYKHVSINCRGHGQKEDLKENMEAFFFFDRLNYYE